MDFARYIRELLIDHDCVILPGLGGFIANYKPAEIIPEQQTIHPPSKHILFNTNLVHNDGLLYAHASKGSGYGYREVSDMADVYTRRIRREVEQGKKFVLDGIGYFYAGTDGILRFASDPSVNFLVGSYGLPSVQYREFSAPSVGRAKLYRAAPAALDPLVRKRRLRRISYTAAAACIAAAMVFIPMKTGFFTEAGLDLQAGDTFRRPEVGTSVAEGTTPEIEAGRTGPLANSIRVPAPPGEVTYHIIVGSFRDFGNARQLRSSFIDNGYQARILAADNNFFRVSAAESGSGEEAGRMLAEIRSQGHGSAWILSH